MADVEDTIGGHSVPNPIALVLHRWQRVVAGLVGLGLLAIAVWAELFAHLDGAGTVAFILAGAALTLFGVVGRVPTRLSGKDFSVEFVQAVEAGVKHEVVQLVEELPEKIREEIASSPTVDDVDGGSLIPEPPTLAKMAASESIHFERRVKDLIGRTLAGRWRVEDAAEVSSMLDLVLLRDDLSVGVVIKAYNATGSRQVLNRIADYRSRHMGMPILLVTPIEMRLLGEGKPFDYRHYGHRHLFLEGLDEALRRASVR